MVEIGLGPSPSKKDSQSKTTSTCETGEQVNSLRRLEVESKLHGIDTWESLKLLKIFLARGIVDRNLMVQSKTDWKEKGVYGGNQLGCCNVGDPK